MKRALARKWAKALESGDYTQTTGELRNSEGFCCLGVLCNIHAQDNPELAATQTYLGEYFDRDTELPDVVTEWAGMSSNIGKFAEPMEINNEEYSEELAASLVDLNDAYDYDFKAIAKVIRKHWKDL